MLADLLKFVDDFVQRLKRQKRAFRLLDIERAYRVEQKSKGNQGIEWSNMLRLKIVSRLLKVKEIHRTYRTRADGLIYLYFYFE
ncbi:hypothetical protein [Enterococcus faecalis]|uniref:hypothetical protein n=1 Tax=Enterococcus faecalis TaxID=1351 RepID=UPI00387A603E